MNYFVKTNLTIAVILFYFFGLNPKHLFSQNNVYGGLGYGSFGLGSFSTSGIKDLLGSNQNIPTQCILGGGGGFAYMNRFVIGGSGNGAAGSIFNFGGEDLQVTHGWGGFEIGYDFSDIIKNKLLATIMIGGRGTDVNILSGPEKNKNISNGSPLIGLNFYALRFVVCNKTDNEGGIGGFMIGLKAGAWISMASSKWEYSGNLPLNKISYAPYGFFAGLTIGGGGFGIKK